MADRQADQFSHENIAFPLAEYYRSIQKPDEIRAVLKLYGAAVIRMSEKAMPILAVGWLQQLHNVYLRFEMNADAADVLRQFRPCNQRFPAI